MNNILEVFEHTVRTYPDKKAVGFQEKSYSFAELRHLSLCLARKITETLSENCGGNQPVAVLVNRGIQTPVFFLAVLYSGNFYVPVDPEMPVTKIQAELNNSGTTLLLCEDENDELVSQLHFSGNVLKMSDMAETENTIPETSKDDPIYMVYTSGSTGTPKGVIKSHGAVLSFIEAFAKTFDLTDAEVIGNQTPFFFDASAKDFYLMVYTGATMEILPSELFIFPIRLFEYMNERGITYICWVPTALSIVVQMKTFQKILPETLQKVFFVGEVFPIKQLRAWLATLPQLQYVNLYGSTEISGISCYYELDPSKEYDFLPMGKALSNCDVFLYENGQVITATGEIGEVCVASPALALGYYKDAAKTNAAFCELTLADQNTKRVLKTGDYARYDENHDLVFVSRKDFQIKHMGRRIELGEIEASVDAVPEIQRCCCLYNQEKKKICLFCELIPGCTWTKQDVKSELRGRLSDYMLPSKVVILDQMPFNANGKIDRTKLKEQL